MATITRYINPDSTAGGDGTTNATTGANRAYVSLSAWEAAEQQDLDTGNNIAEAICETNGTADTTVLTIDGWTTSATDYIVVKTSSGHRHAGKWDTSKFRLTVSTDATALFCYEGYTVIEGLQVSFADYDYRSGVYCDAINTPIYIKDCIIKGTGSTGVSKRGVFFTDSTQPYVRNSLIYDILGTSAVGLRVGGSTNPPYGYIYSNTFRDCTTGVFEDGWQEAYYYNNLVDNCTTSFSGYAQGAENNAVSTASGFTGATQANNRTSQTFTFVDAANDDFHLASTDTGALSYGKDLSADSAWPFSTDIDGQTRTGTWDIGADEYVAAGGGWGGLLSSQRNRLVYA